MHTKAREIVRVRVNECVSVWVCVRWCMSVRDRERERERDREIEE